MVQALTFTVAVFQDAAWARRGVEALAADGFSPSALTILGKESPEVQSLCEDALGAAPERLDVRSLGSVMARGPLVAALQGDDKALAAEGVGGTMTRAGFQRHDGYIFETLVGRGGVLVAVHDGRRAADALAKMHSFGGGNAAIGAWSGRV
jgi:hypothetical protein